MEVIDGIVILGTRDCRSCISTPGTQSKRIPCPTCHGSGNGARGGRGGCKKCYGSGNVYDQINRVPCVTCDGNYHNAATEDITDYLPASVVSSLPIRVYRSDRRNSWNESNLALGCVYSSTDYGDAAKMTDAEVIAKVSGTVDGYSGMGRVQACKLVNRDDSTLCDHVGVFVTRDGYSVRAVFAPNGGESVAKDAASELTHDEATVYGGAVYGAGGNGTMAAASLRMVR